jgi:hypothetical protein
MAKYGRGIIEQFLPPVLIRISMNGILDGRVSVPSAPPSSKNAIILQAGDKESFFYLNKFRRLEDKRVE